MSLTERRDGSLIPVALTEFSGRYEDADSEFAEHASQLVVDHRIDLDVGPAEDVDALESRSLPVGV